MSVDVLDLDSFYAGPLGDHARRVVLATVERFWGGRAPRSLLGLGYATPYLDPIAVEASARRIAFMPARQGVIGRTGGRADPAALVDPGMLPLADAMVDRVFAVHVLENVAEPAEVLSEIGRVLEPGGRLLLVCPNRGGLWARLDLTPFGHGQPYSRSQLRRLLRENAFEPERWAEILYVPPLRHRRLLPGAPAWERAGEGLRLPGAGLHVVDATRQLHRPVLVRSRPRVARRPAVLVPVTAATREPALRIHAADGATRQ